MMLSVGRVFAELAEHSVKRHTHFFVAHKLDVCDSVRSSSWVPGREIKPNEICSLFGPLGDSTAA